MSNRYIMSNGYVLANGYIMSNRYIMSNGYVLANDAEELTVTSSSTSTWKSRLVTPGSLTSQATVEGSVVVFGEDAVGTSATSVSSSDPLFPR